MIVLSVIGILLGILFLWLYTVPFLEWVYDNIKGLLLVIVGEYLLLVLYGGIVWYFNGTNFRGEPVSCEIVILPSRKC